MSCYPINEVGNNYERPEKRKNFFSNDEDNKILKWSINNEFHVDPLNPCQRNLFIGAFLDGTNNDYLTSYRNRDLTETNVVHLYNAYPGKQMYHALAGLPGDWREKTAKYDNYYKIYVSGVGTTFLPVEDRGGMLDSSRGSAQGYLGEPRILWALMQVLNAVFQFGNNVDTPLFSYDGSHYHGIDMVGVLNGRTADFVPSDALIQSAEWSAHARASLGDTQTDLKAAALFRAWLTDLKRCLRPGLHGVDRIKTIHLSCFGFSRGAVEARCFAHYLVKMCALDARLHGLTGLTLGGKPVSFDFMGLFDSVASVGVSRTFPGSVGHDEWGNCACIRVPSALKECVHMVAAHEQRTDFPLDSIFAGGHCPDNVDEVVFPGVHSDVGGGYAPGNQGKGRAADGKRCCRKYRWRLCTSVHDWRAFLSSWKRHLLKRSRTSKLRLD